jgi:putative oxidoreductase
LTRAPQLLRAVRLIAGGVFVVFGAGKFVNHPSELASFRTYGLPAPEVFVIVVGVVELVGGALLIANRLVKPAALVLAADMVGAIVVSGIAKGELISLTLAPALLLAMAALLLAPADRLGPHR